MCNLELLVAEHVAEYLVAYLLDVGNQISVCLSSNIMYCGFIQVPYAATATLADSISRYILASTNPQPLLCLHLHFEVLTRLALDVKQPVVEKLHFLVLALRDSHPSTCLQLLGIWGTALDAGFMGRHRGGVDLVWSCR
jgi:hypothetical protein